MIYAGILSLSCTDCRYMYCFSVTTAKLIVCECIRDYRPHGKDLAGEVLAIYETQYLSGEGELIMDGSIGVHHFKRNDIAGLSGLVIG